uniref:ATP synthase subunit a n=1 Tax=Sabella spallanzanii TaxID=85702 RepID=A0A7T1WKF1_SABSP|nr:ATP synthase F0 subunit 6 [Sabella spallanzanii]QPO99966.1 ATP synthase F0 subunit 6 [Sabella spallanzanii]UJM44188.1 ATP synthase F0 subunit 6 [Sabella spallanzanii]UYP50932.1 ATP synthase F0 subunit 6 [Sabella spallanzanii]
MMPDIFSIFDPSTNTIFHYSPLMMWLVSLFALLLISSPLWLCTPTLTIVMYSASKLMLQQSSQTLTRHLKGLPTGLSATFVFLVLVNLSTMIPYSFNPSSHLLFSLTLGLVMWLALTLSSMTKSSSYLAGLLPMGAPDWLSPALVLMESMSILLRPITLSFRLAANMTAGHIIFSLLATYMVPAMTSASFWSSLTFLLILSGYCMFEFGICAIQAYIFCLLLSLYANEHPM